MQGETQGYSLARTLIDQKLRFIHHAVSSIGVTFDEEYLTIPGFIYIILQQMMPLNINIIEVSSTCTELVLYIDEKDMKIAYEALEASFIKK